MEDESPTPAAALPKPKKQLTQAQRSVESAKRQGRRQRAKLRLAEQEATAAAARVAESQYAAAFQARDNAIAIQAAAAARVAESQSAAAFQARDKAIAIQAATQVVLMLKGDALNTAGIVRAPPRPGSPALSSASPPCVLPRGLAPSQLSGSRDTSPEISFVPNVAASTLALQETLKGLIAEKEMSSVKRGERNRRGKEDHMDFYLEIQKRRLEVDESNARSRAKEVDLKSKEVELMILAEENRIMMADLSTMEPDTRAWFVKRQKAIRERDA